MTRRDQIINKALEIDQQMTEQEMCINWCLVEMAEWADANNHDAEIQFELTKQNKSLQKMLAMATEALTKAKHKWISKDSNWVIAVDEALAQINKLKE